MFNYYLKCINCKNFSSQKNHIVLSLQINYINFVATEKQQKSQLLTQFNPIQPKSASISFLLRALDDYQKLLQQGGSILQKINNKLQDEHCQHLKTYKELSKQAADNIQKLSQYKSAEQIQTQLQNIQQEFYQFQQKYSQESTKLQQLDKQQQLSCLNKYLISSPYIKNYYIQNITYEQIHQLQQLSISDDNNIVPNSIQQIPEDPHSVHFLIFQNKDQSNSQTMNALYNLKVVFQEIDPMMFTKNLQQEYATQQQILDKVKNNFITILIQEREALIQILFETVLAQCITQAALRYKNITYLYYCIADEKQQKQYLKLLDEINNKAQVEESEKQLLGQFGDSGKQTQKIVFVSTGLN